VYRKPRKRKSLALFILTGIHCRNRLTRRNSLIFGTQKSRPVPFKSFISLDGSCPRNRLIRRPDSWPVPGKRGNRRSKRRVLIGEPSLEPEDIAVSFPKDVGKDEVAAPLGVIAELPNSGQSGYCE
jgi:hypothetical protein